MEAGKERKKWLTAFFNNVRAIEDDRYQRHEGWHLLAPGADDLRNLPPRLSPGGSGKLNREDMHFEYDADVPIKLNIKEAEIWEN